MSTPSIEISSPVNPEFSSFEDDIHECKGEHEDTDKSVEKNTTSNSLFFTLNASNFNRTGFVGSILCTILFWAFGSVVPYLGSPMVDILVSIAFSLIGYTFMKSVVVVSCSLYICVHGSAAQLHDGGDMDVWAGAASVCSIIANCTYYIAANNGVPASVVGPASVCYVILPMIFESITRGCLGVLPSVGIFFTLGGALILAVSKTGSFELVWCVYILLIWIGYGIAPLMMQRSRFNKSIKELSTSFRNATPTTTSTTISSGSLVETIENDVEYAYANNEVIGNKDAFTTATKIDMDFDLIEKLEKFCMTTKAQVMVESTVICLSLIGWGIQTGLQGSLPPDVWYIVLYGACFSMGTMFYFVALAFSENASVPTAACNLFVIMPVIYGWAVLKEAIVLTRIFGAFLAIAGSMLLILFA